MKPFITAMLGALTLAVAAPAIAQDWNRDRPNGWDIDRREQWLDERIERGLADGSLSRHEAHKVRDIRQLEERMRRRHDGRLVPEDREVLEAKLDDLSDRIHWDRESHEMAPWRR